MVETGDERERETFQLPNLQGSAMGLAEGKNVSTILKQMTGEILVPSGK